MVSLNETRFFAGLEVKVKGEVRHAVTLWGQEDSQHDFQHDCPNNLQCEINEIIHYGHILIYVAYGL